MATINIHIWKEHNFYRLYNMKNTSVNLLLLIFFFAVEYDLFVFVSLYYSSISSFCSILLLCILSKLDNHYLEKRRRRTNLKTNLKIFNSV